MSAIFISHSNKDHSAAIELKRRLETQGHRSLFLDFDPELGIPPGRKWEQELYRQLRACHAVIVLCSEYSMSSRWCFAEITHAKSLGKHVFPVKVGPCAIDPVLMSRQIIDMTQNQEDAYQRLWRGLKVAGLDPTDSFDWDCHRAPYPGMMAFQEEDAAVFFGREAEIQQGLELLQRMRQFGGSRMLLVFGASGSGKSSLVRAGLLPRLRRNPECWLIVDPFRPKEHPLRELAIVLADAFSVSGEKRNWQEICEQSEQVARTEKSQERIFLNEVALGLQIARKQREATTLLIIDQAEELLVLSKGEKTASFLSLLHFALKTPNSPLIAIFTLRSDFLSDFQRQQALLGLSRVHLSVGPIAKDHLAKIIKGPARIAGIELGEGLTEAMIRDTENQDALPLLAFTLRELYERCGKDKLLEVHDYREKVGGLSGAVARVADAALEAAKLTIEQEEALKNALVSLARINEEGQFTRQPARWSDLPESAHGTLERFVKARLLISRGDEKEPMVEVAHEAIFTHWPRLKEWIESRWDDLRLLRQVRLAAAEWDKNGRAAHFLWLHERLLPVAQMVERMRPALNLLEQEFIRPESDRLLKQIDDPATTHQQRVKIGDRLSEIGDPRPGVHLREDGLPDIAWCKVTGGKITLELKAGTFIVKPFFIAKYPVTWIQYRTFLEAKDGYRNESWWEGLAERQDSPGEQYREHDNHPAENVSWYDALAYCRWLSKWLGYEIQLPTEWEWQQAATGGDRANEYPWGRDWDSERANTFESGLSRTTAVGLYPRGASPVGALDMCGNVLEWCLNAVENPKKFEVSDSKNHVVRGGSWGHVQFYAHVANRLDYFPHDRLDGVGFRLCCASPSSEPLISGCRVRGKKRARSALARDFFLGIQKRFAR